MRFKLLVTGLILLGTGCDLLLKLLDTTPPVCYIRTPLDSAAVSGIINVQAEAYDSGGIAVINLYVDGTLFVSESSNFVSAYWDTRQLPDGSWHKIFCIASDLAGNQGTSDTVHIQILAGYQRSVFHGRITLANQYYRYIDFSAKSAETINGETRATPGGKISRFVFLDRDNFQKYRSGQSYTAIYEQVNVTELSLSYRFTTNDIYYLIFSNITGTTQTY